MYYYMESIALLIASCLAAVHALRVAHAFSFSWAPPPPALPAPQAGDAGGNDIIT